MNLEKYLLNQANKINEIIESSINSNIFVDYQTSNYAILSVYKDNDVFLSFENIQQRTMNIESLIDHYLIDHISLLLEDIKIIGIKCVSLKMNNPTKNDTMLKTAKTDFIIICSCNNEVEINVTPDEIVDYENGYIMPDVIDDNNIRFIAVCSDCMCARD